MFIYSPLYLELEMYRAYPLEILSKVRSVQFHLHRAIVIVLYNYKYQFTIWVVTFDADTSITRSYYLRLTLCGYRETPSCDHLITCNARSIKPIHYKRINIINFNNKKQG